MQREHRVRPRRISGLLLAGACLPGAGLAQQNAAYLDTVVRPVLVLSCQDEIGTPCEASGFQPADVATLAPDKYVTLSTTALAALKRDFATVQQRLTELRAPEPVVGQARLLSGGGGGGAGGGGTAAPVAAGTPSAPSAERAGAGEGFVPGHGFYLHVEGGRGSFDATSRDPGFSQRGAEFTFGADTALGPKGVVGASVTYARQRSTLDKVRGVSGGRMERDAWSTALYGAYHPSDTSYLDATLVAGRGRYDTQRIVVLEDAAPQVNESVRGSTDATHVGLSAGGGLNFLDGRVNYGPYLRANWSRVKIDPFTERRTTSDVQLAVRGQRITSLTSQLGLQASYAISTSWGVVVPAARVEWEHQYKDDRSRRLVASFALGDPDNAMALQTSEPDRNYFNLGAGVAAHFGVGRSAFVNLQSVLGRSGVRQHTLTAELRLEF